MNDRGWRAPATVNTSALTFFPIYDEFGEKTGCANNKLEYTCKFLIGNNKNMT
jgi:hypothetical protein